MPYATTFSFGGLSGYCCGVAVKKVSKAAVGVFGGLFCIAQLAHQQGYVTVHMEKVEKDVMKILDTNEDGKLDEKDAAAWLSKSVGMLTCDTKISAGKIIKLELRFR